jgi:DNA-binding PadR family transcriptional regulator
MERNQIIRAEALLQLYGAGQRIGITAASITRQARRQGDDFAAGEIESALLFLEGQGFAEKLRNEATGEVRFKITSQGILQYERDH